MPIMNNANFRRFGCNGALCPQSVPAPLHAATPGKDRKETAVGAPVGRCALSGPTAPAALQPRIAKRILLTGGRGLVSLDHLSGIV